MLPGGQHHYGTNGFTHTYATYDSQVLIGYEYDVAGQSSIAYLDGYIDEVRISKTNRSLSWIQTEYNNDSMLPLSAPLGASQTSISTAVSSTPIHRFMGNRSRLPRR